MNPFVISDTHWGHHNIIKYCARPFHSVREMDKVMIERWNELVKPTDRVIHVGDFAFYPINVMAELRKKLNGRITLVKGNHDKSAARMLECGFDEVVNELTLDLPEGRVLFTHHPVVLARETQYFRCLHGHVHEKWRRVGNNVNMSVDVWDFRPVLLSDAIKCERDSEKTQASQERR